jgi:glycosyltransferase involved in cell wall biosynthesis
MVADRVPIDTVVTMRIAHVVSTYPPYRGGMGRAASEIAARQIGAIVVTSASSHQPEVRHVFPVATFGNAAWCPMLNIVLEREKIDLVHFHWPFIGGLASVLRWRRADVRRRLVVQYHMDLVAGGWRGEVFSAYQRRAIPKMITVADRIVPTSLDYAGHSFLAPLLDDFRDRLLEIPLGVDSAFFSPQPLSSFQRSNDELDVLFVGGLDRAHRFKGLHVLLGALSCVPKTRLRIVGEGDLRGDYEAAAQALDVSDRTDFLGSLSESQLRDAYRSADVVVLPSTKRSEAFGLVLLEAAACGTPAIASNLPGVRTVIAHNETGLLVPPGDQPALIDAIQQFCEYPDRVMRMSVAARERVAAHYSWQHVRDQWQRCYEDVMR